MENYLQLWGRPLNISQLIRYIALHLISLVGSIVVLTDGDLTLFSLDYLGKVCGTSMLLFTGICLFAEDSQYLSKLKNWQHTLIITSISNFTFLPFLIFLNPEEHLSLWFPAFLAISFMMLWSISLINFKWAIISQWFSTKRLKDLGNLWQPFYSKLDFKRIIYFSQKVWERLLARTTQENVQKTQKSASSAQASLNEKTTHFLNGKTVLVYGATSVLGQAFLDNIKAYVPKKLLLLDKDLIKLELLTIELGKAHPQIEIHSFGVNTLTSTMINSIFSHYNPDFIFDFDRYFCLPAADEGLASFLKTNILIPYWLACNAHSSKSSLMISLHPELIYPEPSFIHAEKILMSNMQRLDSSNLRIINMKVPLFTDDIALPWYLQKLAIGSAKQTLFVDAVPLLDNLLTLAQQLINHPTHYGSLWSPLFAKKLLAKKLATILKADVHQQLEEIKHLEKVKISFKNLITTSHPDLAILQDTMHLDITTDAASYFQELEQLLHNDLEQIETFLQAA